MPEGYRVQRLRGGFAIVWHEDGKRRRRQLVSEDRPSAEAEARKLWASGDDGSPWTVARIMTGYLETITEKPSHGRRQDAWKAMRPFWETVDPDLIDQAMCRSYRARRQVADSTVRYELLQLSTALRWARGQKHIATVPDMWLPTVPENSEPKHLSRTEFDRFYAAVLAEHAQVYVMLGLYTMARPSAILDLTWDRVDFARRQIDFRPFGRVQTRKRRTVVPIGDALLLALQNAYKARTCEFVVERGGTRIANIKKAFQAASARSGVHATPYTLRHTGAVWAAEGGVSMAELAQFMGHDDDRTTQKHYARFSPGHLLSVANAVERRA